MGGPRDKSTKRKRYPSRAPDQTTEAQFQPPSSAHLISSPLSTRGAPVDCHSHITVLFDPVTDISTPSATSLNTFIAGSTSRQPGPTETSHCIQNGSEVMSSPTGRTYTCRADLQDALQRSLSLPSRSLPSTSNISTIASATITPISVLSLLPTTNVNSSHYRTPGSLQPAPNTHQPLPPLLPQPPPLSVIPSDNVSTVTTWQEVRIRMLSFPVPDTDPGHQSIPPDPLPSEAPPTPRRLIVDQEAAELDRSPVSRQTSSLHDESRAQLEDYPTRSSTPSILPSPHVLPLTSGNLSFFSGNMSNPKSGEGTPSTTMKNTSTATMKLGRAEEIMRLNGIVFNDLSARNTAHFVALAKRICTAERTSPPRAPLGDTLLREMSETAMVNEQTMMKIWFHQLVHWDRIPNQVFKPTGGAGAGAEDDEVMEEGEEGQLLNPDGPAFQEFKQWRDDGIYSNWDKDFDRNSVPKLNFIDQNELKVLVNALPRVANPKPDVVFGYADKIFTDLQRSMNLLHVRTAKISDGLNWPFATVDAKLDSMRALRLQCMRAGSAIIAALRDLFSEAGVKKPDFEAWIMSVAITTDIAHVHVHWAETAPDSAVRYHMVPVMPFTLGFADAHTSLRKTISNILDWGLLERKPIIDQALESLIKKQVAASKSKK
ncbi:MAG: hypothetical protein Q9170_007692 [Blastenia crenularia]